MNDKTEVLTNEQIDQALAETLDAIAKPRAMHALEISHDIGLHSTLRRQFARRIYAISAADLKARDAEIESLKFDLRSLKARVNSKNDLLDAIRAVCNERHSDLGIPVYIESLRRDAERLDALENKDVCYWVEIQEQPHCEVIYAGQGFGVRETADRLIRVAAMQGDKSNG